MRKRAVGGIGLAILAAAAGPVNAVADERATVRLRAVRIEVGRLSPLTVEVMDAELSVLLSEAGVSLDWRRARAGGETGRDELRIVFLAGPPRGARAGKPVLAASGQAGHAAPTVWVYTSIVVGALHLGHRSSPDSFPAQRALGVALGRVLAHELVHLLAPEVPHGSGLMSARFRLAALDGPRPCYDRTSARALASAARSWRARGGPAPQTERRARLAAAVSAEHAADR